MHSMNEPGKSESGLSVVGQLKVLCSHTVMMGSKLGREGAKCGGRPLPWAKYGVSQNLI